MEKFKGFLAKHATKRRVLVLFVLTNLIYFLMVLVTIPATVEYSRGLQVLDMMPLGYDFDYVEALFAALGEDGRDYYLYRQIPLDMLYPLLFAVGYSLLLAFFLKKINKLNRLYLLCLIPFLAGLADYLENFGIIALLNSYPGISSSVVTITAFFSILKSVSTTVYFFSLTGVVIVLFFKSVRAWGTSLKIRRKQEKD